MDEFKNLNWLWKGSGSAASSLYKKQISDDEKDIFFCHLNEIDHIHLLDNYGLGNDLPTENKFIRTDPRTGQEVTKELYYHGNPSKTVLFAQFPERSSMNSQQHQSCLNAIAKLRGDPSGVSMSDRNDIRVYGQLTIERNREKAKFYEFVKSEFYKRNIKNCYDLQTELNKFITKRWQDAVQSASTANNTCYQLQSAIPISRADSDGDATVEHEKTIKQTGVVLMVNPNKYRNLVRLSCPFLNHFFSNITEITLDPLDDSFIQSESIDVVISLKTLAAILSSARILSTDWNVTFTVKTYEDKNVVIFDDLLPALSLGCLEKNRLAFMHAVKANIVVPKKNEVFSFETNQFVERVDRTFDPNFIRQPQPLEESVSNYKIWEYEEYLQKFGASVPSSESLTLDTNRTRRLWKVKRNNVDCCRLVVDSSQDYCEKQKDGTVKHVNLSPKLEYQCEFGAEQMTLAELIAEWCALRFGPDTITHRVRINASTGGVTDMKVITISDVEYDLQRLYRVKSETLLVPLLNCIEKIKQFPANEYLLSHLGKHNAQAMVYVKSIGTSSGNTIRIADLYKSRESDSSTHLETIEWNPIDDTICTAIHSAVMPCAFNHWVNGKKRGVAAPSNDRLLMVEKALRKDREKEEKEQTKQNLIKKRQGEKKNRKANHKRKLLQAKRPKFEGESLDPNVLFDEQGNINILDLVSSGYAGENHQSGEQNSLSESVCLETYCRDAGTVPDDSIEG
ncbi:uncharacterized protein LOC119071532 [Bradysia coprophila]|uniref:uncharacterized protein LOC119071532 n=1 Tax=Bradysia coprophila TaxID=38358 RepID=UPI00187DBD93|nr:uncharacterized protein LOC119071532 [Bradysia coprophila]